MYVLFIIVRFGFFVGATKWTNVLLAQRVHTHRTSWQGAQWTCQLLLAGSLVTLWGYGKSRRSLHADIVIVRPHFVQTCPTLQNTLFNRNISQLMRAKPQRNASHVTMLRHIQNDDYDDECALNAFWMRIVRAHVAQQNGAGSVVEWRRRLSDNLIIEIIVSALRTFIRRIHWNSLVLERSYFTPLLFTVEWNDRNRHVSKRGTPFFRKTFRHSTYSPGVIKIK